MRTDNLRAQRPITIPGGTDFNSLVQPGTYQLLWYDAAAQNTPTGGNACQLAVSRIADNVILQTCTVWRGGLVYETYQRIREDGTWTAWDKLLSANDVQRAAVTAVQIAQVARMIAVNPDRTRCPYEVGDILQTINSTPPAQRWPGTQWQQITDRFVRGADAQHPAGSTGGSWQHLQTVEEMPSHGHQIWTYQYAPGASDHQLINSGDVPSQYAEFWSTTTGGGQPMDITNPYYSAYIWLRTG